MPLRQVVYTCLTLFYTFGFKAGIPWHYAAAVGLLFASLLSLPYLCWLILD